MEEKQYDILIVGEGAGGFAAAMECMRRDLHTAWICRGNSLAGAFGAGLSNSAQGVFDLPYEGMEKLIFRAWGREYFEPMDMEAYFRREARYGNLDIYISTEVLSCKAKNGRLKSVKIVYGGQLLKLKGKCFIDATMEGALCRAVGTESIKEAPWYALNARIGGLDLRMGPVFEQEFLDEVGAVFVSEVLDNERPRNLAMPFVTPLPRGTTAVLMASAVFSSSGEGHYLALEERCIEQTRKALKLLGRASPGWLNAYVINFAAQPMRLFPAPMPARGMLRVEGRETLQAELPPSETLLSAEYENLLLAGGTLGATFMAALPYLSFSGQLAVGALAGKLARESMVYDGAVDKAFTITGDQAYLEV